MADFIIELEGRQFQRGYLLYIIEIHHGSDSYYYVGQTGDRNYITARPAFRRLSGHFEDRETSTQNQIYKFLMENIISGGEATKTKKYDDGTKQEVETFLVGSNVSMHIYEVLAFNPGIAREDHLSNVRKIVDLERKVIKAFIDSDKRIMNKSPIESDGVCPYPGILLRIKSDFELK